MAELPRSESGKGLYERLLHRLALALDEADTAIRLRDEQPHELELRGLTPAELELIQAYLERDLHWLRGWHAAAAEIAQIEALPRRNAKLEREGSKPLMAKVRVALKHRQQLCCAMCGAPATWQRGQGIPACLSCGSQLFRTSNPR